MSSWPSTPEQVEYKRAYNRARYWTQRDRFLAQAKEYAKTRAGRLTHKGATLRYDSANPIKRRAYGFVKYAIAKGALVRPSACSNCGAKGPVEAHHPDYNKPMEVEWLCTECHATLHVEERALA